MRSPCTFPLIALILFRFITVHAVQNTWYEGTDDEDCAGTTDTVDDVVVNTCSSPGLRSCILVEFDGSSVDASNVYSSQNGDNCAVLLSAVEDGEYYSQTSALSGYKWTAASSCSSTKRRREVYRATYDMGEPSEDLVKAAAAVLATRSESSVSTPIGYTVKGNLYNCTQPEEQAQIPSGSAEVKIKWLQDNGYQVIDRKEAIAAVKQAKKVAREAAESK